MMNSRTAKVVTLMPPAVPALPPPMNIRTSVPSSVSGCRSPVLTLSKPAVRGCTPWNTPATTFPPTLSGPRVLGFAHSSARDIAMPHTSSRTVIDATSLVCSVHRRGVRHARQSSNRTGKPSPPATTSAHSTKPTIGSVAKPIMLSVNSAKPALLKADTAWKTPSHTARDSGSS